jgi:hypothetical protein
MQLIVSESWWFVLVCLAIGFLYAYLLYSKSKNKLFMVLAAFRMLVVATLCFFLLEPIIVRYLKRNEQPKILMVLDNSESIQNAKTPENELEKFKKQWYNLKAELGENYDVEYLNMGSKSILSDSSNFKDKRSNLSQAFDFINSSYTRQNIGAVVFASDGIYNRGSNPLYKQLNEHSILYSVGLGDSTLKKDLILNDVNANDIAYLNNEYPIEINLSSYACESNNTQLSITREGKTLHTETININNSNFYKNTTVMLPADQPGTQHLKVSLSSIKGEFSTINNSKDVFIDIIDGREKVLLVYSGPHPDIGAIKEAIQSNQNYEVVSKPLNEVSLSDVKQFSVTILHQVPNTVYNPRNLINALRAEGIPIWVIAGSMTFVDQLQLISPAAKIDRNQGRFNESQAYYNSNFKLFELEDKTKTLIASLPPLKTPYGQYSGAEQLNSLLYQKIGSVNTSIPLWSFSTQNNEKTAYLFGEGFWKWRMMDYAENESHDASNELVNKTIQFLTVKEDKRKFRVYPSKNSYDEDEAVKFYAELYNASYEPINTADVKLTLSNSDNKIFNYTFSKTGKSYVLDLGLLAPGTYTYVAKTTESTETISGKIIVKPLQLEMINTRADFGLLRSMSQKHNGQFVYANELNKLKELIVKNQNVSSISYNEKKPDELINLKLIFFILLGLLSLEWFIRKYEGAY